MPRMIIRKVNGRPVAVVDISGCFWCSQNESAICASCSAKADAAVAKLEARDAAK